MCFHYNCTFTVALHIEKIIILQEHEDNVLFILYNEKKLIGNMVTLVVYGLVHSQDFAVILWQKTKEPLSNFNLLYLMILHQRGLLSFHLGFLIMTDRHWISVYDINPSRWRLCEQCYGCRTFIVGYLMREADSTVLKMALKV